MNNHIAYISIGSNIGNKKLNCENAIGHIDSNKNITIKCVSDFYKTEPVDYLDQDWFINAIICIETTLSPKDLLSELKNIEKKSGRKKHDIRFGPRILDLDIIYYDDLVLKSEALTIPHMRMHKRHFVLKPLTDIEPDFIHPVLKKNTVTLLNELSKFYDKDDQKIIRV